MLRNTALSALSLAAIAAVSGPSRAQAQCAAGLTWSGYACVSISADINVNTCPSGMVMQYGSCVSSYQPTPVSTTYGVRTYQTPTYQQRTVETEIINRPTYGLVLGGALAFVVGYLVPVILVAEIDTEADDFYLYIPFAGPFLENEFGGDADDWLPLSITAAILQLGGLAAFVLGFIIRQQVEVESWVVTPWFSPDGGGGTAVRGVF